MAKVRVKRVWAQSVVFSSNRPPCTKRKKMHPDGRARWGSIRTNHELNSALRLQAISTPVSERLHRFGAP